MTVGRPFTLLELVEPTIWQKLLRRKPAENAPIEINNLFARAARVRDVASADIARIGAEHGVDIRSSGGLLDRLYRDYLTYCLQDRQLSDDELADLTHLKTVLGMDAETVRSLHEYVARHVYGRTVTEVLADGVIDDGERAFLARVQRELAVPRGAAERIVEAKLRQQTGESTRLSAPPQPYDQ